MSVVYFQLGGYPFFGGSPLRVVAALCLALLAANGEEPAIFSPATAAAWATFADPGIRPASFIYAADQLWPPYDINVDVLEPFPRCSSTQAALCGVQHAIRLVTQARWNACPELAADATRRQAALDVIAAGNYSVLAPSSTGIDIFVFNEAGTILADPLRPELEGKAIYGVSATGGVPQPSLMGHIQWVISWGGGWVPHTSTRLQDGDPIAVATYMEACPGTGDRLAVSIGRNNSLLFPDCAPTSNAVCALRNVDAIVGVALYDLLTAKSAREMSANFYKISFYTEGKVAGFAPALVELSWWGYPGSDELRNPSPLSDTQSVILATGNNQYFIGMNDSEILGGQDDSTVIHRLINMGSAAWNGGGVVTMELDTWKVKLVLGFAWNATAYAIVSGPNHAPGEEGIGPLCTVCSSNFSIVCGMVNAQALVSHARVDQMIAGHDWNRITYFRWFGAWHDEAIAGTEVGTETWPDGFHLVVFSVNGTCVAHGGQASLVGKTATEIFGNADAHQQFLLAASSGERWTPFVDNSVPKLAYVQATRKNYETFYILTSVGQAWMPWMELDECSSSYAENCSFWNSEALIGGVAGEILAQYDEAGVLEVVQAVHERDGLFAPSAVSDFRAYIYDGDFECWQPAKAAGIVCPPELSGDSINRITSALGNDFITSVSITLDSAPVVATIHSRIWMPLDGVSSEEFFIVTFIKQRSITPHCSDDADCPEGFACSSSTRRCECAGDALPNLTLTWNECHNGLVVDQMKCANVEGYDCTDDSSNVDLTKCRLCTEGYFCTSGHSSPCPTGQYCPAGVASPIPCPAGSTANETMSASCTLCEVGTSSTQAASSQCTSCFPGTYADTAGAASCKICAADSYSALGEASCTACPGGSFADTIGATSVDQCRLCSDGFYFDGAGCMKCLFGFSAPELDATSCSVSSEAQAIVFSLLSVIFLAGIVFVLTNRFFGRRMEALRRKADLAALEVVQRARESCLEFPLPLALMNVNTFVNLREREMHPSYEGHRDAGRLQFFDTMASVEDFRRRGNKIIFVSHRRIMGSTGRSSGLRSPTTKSVKRALFQVLSELEWYASECYIWIDAWSVPQDHELLLDLGTESLYAYARCSDLFLAVCPEPTQREKEQYNSSGLELYEREAWRRAEVLAYICGHGPDNVYIFEDDAGLQEAHPDWKCDMCWVFEGEFSCCRRGHSTNDSACDSQKLVLPMLALFCDGLRRAIQNTGVKYSMSAAASESSNKPGEFPERGVERRLSKPEAVSFFQAVVYPEKEHIFPAQHVFNLAGNAAGQRGCTQVQDLFGNLLKISAGKGAVALQPVDEYEFQGERQQI